MPPVNDHTLVILHGSQATGQAAERSDWDVAVLRDHVLSFAERAELRRTLARRFAVSEEKVDISDLKVASPLLRYRVAIHGHLLSGDPRDLAVFQLRAWKDHLDNAKFAELGAASLRKALS